MDKGKDTPPKEGGVKMVKDEDGVSRVPLRELRNNEAPAAAVEAKPHSRY